MSADNASRPNALSATVTFHYRQAHARVLQLLDDLSDEQVQWRPTPTAPSIGFNFWHLARWADHLQATIPGMTPELGRRLGPGGQLWEMEGLAAQWQVDSARLGYAETGMLMDDDAAAHLRLPAKDVLLDYARRAFTAADRAVSAIDDQQFQEREQPQDADQAAGGATDTVGNALTVHLAHANRHLGMIECLRGLQGLRGTATR